MSRMSEMSEKYGYKTEEERLQKIKDNQHIVESFWAAMKDKIQHYRERAISFFVFDMDLDNKILVAGMRSCCEKVTDEMRRDIESKIIERTVFDNVIWEI